ncbi:MAG TPA: type II toxin-antitoxin system PemK/MazF family toxin [Blastocatellia bacterium]|nr:type II toxin-antitoxin system PemK/MazF family toxin [Blastocatellia bacterium]
MQRGDIWWANLPDPVGSGPGYRRPVLLIQADSFTRSRIRTVIVAAITKNVALAQAPGNVFLPTHVSGLALDSVVNVSQIITVDKSLLTEYVSSLPVAYMTKVDKGLRLVINL